MNRSIPKLESSFLSCEVDTNIILRKLFVDSGVHGNELKRLLVITNADCLDNKTEPAYKEKEQMSVHDLVSQGYVRLAPKIEVPGNAGQVIMSAHQPLPKVTDNEFDDIHYPQVKNYLIITYDNFSTNRTNPQFRDCTINFDIICHSNYWNLGEFRLRPLKICGYIDGLLNNTRLSGIGKLEFSQCRLLMLDDNFSGYSLSYRAIHGGEDRKVIE